MNKQFNPPKREFLDKVIYKFEAAINAKRDAIWAELKAIEKEIEQGNADHDKIDRYAGLVIKSNNMYNYIHRNVDESMRSDIERIKEGFDAFDRIYRNMHSAFADDCVLIVDDDKLILPLYGDLSMTLNLLAAKYELKSGMFSFDSSFSVHEVYTENGYKFKAYVSRENMLVLDFGFNEYLDDEKLQQKIMFIGN